MKTWSLGRYCSGYSQCSSCAGGLSLSVSRCQSIGWSLACCCCGSMVQGSGSPCLHARQSPRIAYQRTGFWLQKCSIGHPEGEFGYLRTRQGSCCLDFSACGGPACLYCRSFRHLGHGLFPDCAHCEYFVGCYFAVARQASSIGNHYGPTSHDQHVRSIASLVACLLCLAFGA